MNRHSLSHPLTVRTALLGMAAVLSSAASAQPYFDPEGLLPSPWYHSSDWAQFDGGASIRLPAVQILGGRIAPPQVGNVATTTFDVTGWVEIKPGPPIIDQAPGQGEMWMHTAGPSQIDTELLQLDISGGDLPAGVMIRESPTRSSLGQVTLQEVSGGYMVDSFFDVFFDLSLDGGQSWLPAVQSVRLQGVPEPASLSVLGVGIAMALHRRRRSRPV